MSVAKVTFQGDAASVVKAAADATSANEKIDKSLEEIAKQSKETGKQSVDMGAKMKKGADDAKTSADKLREANERLAAKIKTLKEIATTNTTTFQQLRQESNQLSVEYNRLSTQTGIAINDNGKLRQSFTSLKGAGTSTFTGLLAGAKSLVAGLGLGIGVAGAIKLITSEMEALEALSKKQAEKFASVEGAEAAIVQNIAVTGDPVVDAENGLRAVQGGIAISQKTNLPILDVQSAVASGLSASGGDIDATLAAVEQQAELNRATPGDLQAGTAGVLSVMAGMKTNNADAAQGILEGVGMNSRLSSPAAVSSTVPGLLKFASGYGYDIQETAALFSQSTQETDDATGERSATGMRAFIKEIFEFFDSGAGKKYNVGEDGEKLGLYQQIQMLQSNAKLGAEYLDKSALPSEVSGPVRNMILDVTSTMSTGVDRIIAESATSEEELAMRVESRRARTNALPSVQEGDIRRAADSSTEQNLYAGAEESPGVSLTKAKLQEEMQAAGAGSWDQFAAGFDYSARRMLFGQSESEAYTNTMQSAIGYRSERDPEVADKLKAGLDEVVGELKKVNANLEKSTTAPRTPDRQAAGGA